MLSARVPAKRRPAASAIRESASARLRRLARSGEASRLAARTAVVAGTANAVTNASAAKQQQAAVNRQNAAIADQAQLRGTGARGLRAILEEVLMPVMFEVPSEDDIARVVVTREVVLDNVLPTLVRREAPARAKRPRKESA